MITLRKPDEPKKVLRVLAVRFSTGAAAELAEADQDVATQNETVTVEIVQRRASAEVCEQVEDVVTEDESITRSRRNEIAIADIAEAVTVGVNLVAVLIRTVWRVHTIVEYVGYEIRISVRNAARISSERKADDEQYNTHQGQKLNFHLFSPIWSP